MSAPSSYSRKRKASCLEIVVSQSKGSISRDIIKNIILPMIHTKFNWDEVMGELTLVCSIVWANYNNREVNKGYFFNQNMIYYAKLRPIYALNYIGLAKLDSTVNYEKVRDQMKNWYFINTKEETEVKEQ
jgi:hypothetical protein